MRYQSPPQKWLIGGTAFEECELNLKVLVVGQPGAAEVKWHSDCLVQKNCRQLSAVLVTPREGTANSLRLALHPSQGSPHFSCCVIAAFLVCCVVMPQMQGLLL